MRIRVHTKMMLGAALGVVVLVAVVVCIAYYIAHKALENRARAHLLSVAQSRADHVEAFLYAHAEVVRTATTSIILADGLRSLRARSSEAESVVRKLNERLELLADPDGHIHEATLLDRDGRVVASSDQGSIGLDRSMDAYFLGARSGPFVKDAYRSATTGRKTLAVSSPLFDRPGDDLLGVLVVRFDMSEIDTILSDSTGLGETGETYLINKYGFMITPTRYLEDPFLKVKLDTENARAALADVEAMRAGRLSHDHAHATVACPDYRGVPVMGAHDHVLKMGWSLLAEIDREEAFAPVARLETALSIIGALSVGAALILAWLFARRISGPIHQLHQGSERIGAGELDYHLHIKTGDEIEQLANEFNRMAERLEESHASLERKVAERTADLEREVVEHQQAEQAVRESEASYRLLVENLPQRIFVKDRASVYVSCNENYARDLKISPEEIVGKTDYDLYPIELAEKYRTDDGRVMETGRAEEIEEKYIQDGREMVVQTVKTPVKSEDGEVFGVLGIFWDITERKRAEKEIETLKQRIEFILGATKTGIDIIDSDFMIRYIDPEWQKVYGDPAGRKCYEYYMGRNEVCPGCGIVKALKTKTVVVTEEALIKENNRPIQVTTIPFQNEEGEWLVAEVNVDITERKRAEEELKRHAERLKSLNAELERSNRDLQEFTYTVSHDLQEPLRKVHTFGQFLVEDCGDHLPAEGIEHLRRMQDAAVRMKGLIQHLLALTRVGTRGGELVPVESQRVVVEVGDTFNEQVEEHGAQLVVEDGFPVVLADAVQLGQVFQNLIGNALKFRSPDRAQRITVAARIQGEKAFFSVADNGIGIEERFIERIFGVFKRLHPREEYEGAGVGLALCKKIIQRHGGRIWAESEPGKGSTFRFTLTVAPRVEEGKR